MINASILSGKHVPLKVKKFRNPVQKTLLLVRLLQTQCYHAWKIMSKYCHNNKKFTSYRGTNTKSQPQNRFKLRSLTFVTAYKEPFVGELILLP
jgi:hypothetical protein